MSLTPEQIADIHLRMRSKYAAGRLGHLKELRERGFKLNARLLALAQDVAAWMNEIGAEINHLKNAEETTIALPVLRPEDETTKLIRKPSGP